MVARGCGDAGKNLVLAIGDRPARQDRDATVDVAPGRHARGPVAALDDARIEIDRMHQRLEMAIGLGALVPLLFQLLQGVDQVIGRGDGV